MWANINTSEQMQLSNPGRVEITLIFLQCGHWGPGKRGKVGAVNRGWAGMAGRWQSINVGGQSIGSEAAAEVTHNLASFPGLSKEGGKAWGLLRAHARKIPFIFCIIRRKISDNDVIVHGESARKEYADTFSTVAIMRMRGIEPPRGIKLIIN